jgi:lipopolysaccharide export system protein LptA
MWKIKFFGILALSFFCLTSFASPGGVTIIKSNSCQCLKGGHVCIYQGDASFTRPTSSLSGPQIVVNKNQDNKVQSIMAKGHGSHYVAEENKKITDAWADQITFYSAKNLVVLVDDASVTQGKNKITGDYFEYDVKRNTVFANPGSHGQKQTILVMQQ